MNKILHISPFCFLIEEKGRGIICNIKSKNAYYIGKKAIKTLKKCRPISAEKAYLPSWLKIVPKDEAEKNLSFLLIKPDAVLNGYTEKIVKEIKKYAFIPIKREKRMLDRKDICFLYPAHIKRDYFKDFISFMSSAPAELIILCREGSSAEILHALAGNPYPDKNPKNSLRKRFGTDGMHNAVHSSDNEENTEREILYFFGSN
ncbi:MAG: nucleoside-diphosphate kinase [Candidatus Paceibacterota bacterium]|jgi:nucleoside-diphosphate kinase